MKNKIIQFIPAILAIIAVGFRYFSKWCIGAEQACFRTLLDRIYLQSISPVFYFAIYFLPIALILAFIPREIFKSWLKLAAWILPLSILYIWVTPVWSNSLLPFNRDDAARLAGQVFAVISILIIIWKWWRSRSNSGQV